MKRIFEALARVAIFALICFVFWWASDIRLSNGVNLSIIVGGVLFSFPLVWSGRKILDKRPTMRRAVWMTTFVHFGVGCTFGVPLVRAITTHQDWSGWAVPVPSEIGLALVVITGTAAFLVVLILAFKGLGAPAIALSRRLATGWLYAWTRNPMVLAALAFFLSLGIWYQSALFILWVLIVVTPALLFFVRTFEERELELRFGSSYVAYRARTPMLFPRRPKS